MTEKQSENHTHGEHHHRKRRKKRRRSRSSGNNMKPLKESLLLIILLTAFVIALGFCLWMIVPPLIEYLGQSAKW